MPEREQIRDLLAAGASMRGIAKALNGLVSTVSREIARKPVWQVTSHMPRAVPGTGKGISPPEH